MPPTPPAEMPWLCPSPASAASALRAVVGEAGRALALTVGHGLHLRHIPGFHWLTERRCTIKHCNHPQQHSAASQPHAQRVAWRQARAGQAEHPHTQDRHASLPAHVRRLLRVRGIQLRSRCMAKQQCCACRPRRPRRCHGCAHPQPERQARCVRWLGRREGGLHSLSSIFVTCDTSQASTPVGLRELSLNTGERCQQHMKGGCQTALAMR